MANQKTIIATNLLVNPDQKGLLLKLFASPEFSLLKQLIISKAIVSQVESMNIALYEDTSETAKLMAESQRRRAAFLQAMLDELDTLSVKEEAWSFVALEHRR